MIEHAPVRLALTGSQALSSRSRTTTHVQLQEVDADGVYSADYDWSPYDSNEAIGGGWKAQLRDQLDNLIADAVVTPGGVRARATITAVGNAGNGDTVTIGGQVYTYTNVAPAVANEVILGATRQLSLEHVLNAATGGAGAGSLYHVDTVRDPLSICELADDVLTVWARDFGWHGNLIAIDTDVAGWTVSEASNLLVDGTGDRGVFVQWPGTDMDQPTTPRLRYRWDLFGILADGQAMRLVQGPATYDRSATDPYST